MTAEESRQLARIAAVTEEADQVLDRLFASVEELKVLLGRTGTEAASVAGTPPPPAPEPAAQPPAAGDVLGTMRTLEAALTGMRTELRTAAERLVAAEKIMWWLKRIVIALSVSFCIDILVTAGLGYNSVQAHDASNRANATVADLHSAQIANCQSGNQTRAQEIELWAHLAQESKPVPGSTPAQIRKDRQAVNALLAYIRHVFAPVDCAARYRLP